MRQSMQKMVSRAASEMPPKVCRCGQRCYIRAALCASNRRSELLQTPLRVWLRSLQKLSQTSWSWPTDCRRTRLEIRSVRHWSTTSNCANWAGRCRTCCARSGNYAWPSSWPRIRSATPRATTIRSCSAASARLQDLILLRQRWAGQITRAALRRHGLSHLPDRRPAEVPPAVRPGPAIHLPDRRRLRLRDQPGRQRPGRRRPVPARDRGPAHPGRAGATGRPDGTVIPIAGSGGLADPLARMHDNFAVLKGQMGFNNPQSEANRFSLRSETLPPAGRLGRQAGGRSWPATTRRTSTPTTTWPAWPSGPSASSGPQPGLVIPFGSTITRGSTSSASPWAAGTAPTTPPSSPPRSPAWASGSRATTPTGSGRYAPGLSAARGQGRHAAPGQRGRAALLERQPSNCCPCPIPIGQAEMAESQTGVPASTA